MDVDEVALILGIHRTNVYRLVNTNKLPGAFRIGKSIRVSRTVFDVWLRNPSSL